MSCSRNLKPLNKENIVFNYGIFALQRYGGISRDYVEVANGGIIAETHNLNSFDFFKTDFKQKMENALKASLKN